MMRTWRIAATALVASVAAAPVAAEWRQATSTHFIVYGDVGDKALRAQAERLERFDSVLRFFHSLPARPDDAANKVTVYVVDDVSSIFGKGKDANNIRGFYLSRVGGSVAFVPHYGDGSKDQGGLTAETVLFHEYAHHLLLGNFAIAYPAWFSEGYAEFVSTVRFDDTRAFVGDGALHRGFDLFNQRGLSAERLFDADRSKLSPDQTRSLYARGWLLTHFIMLDAGRRKALDRYLSAFNRGTPSVTAATEAFGDLKVLDRELDRYLNTRMQAFAIPLDALPQPKVSIRALTPGERAMIGFRVRSDRGVTTAQGAELLARAAPVAAQYPADAAVQGWLAEMAFDADRDDLAEAAADRALAVAPADKQALIYKARVRLRRAQRAHVTDPAVWKEARSWLLKANKADTNDAEALSLFYDSFGMADATPTRNAVAALERAQELVPQDMDLRFRTARQLLLDDRTADARRMLAPLAYSAHASGDGPAKWMIDWIDEGKSGPQVVAAFNARLVSLAKPQ